MFILTKLETQIARHCCTTLSLFCCHLKSHLSALSYPTLWLFSHLYSANGVTHHFGVWKL